jgi:hypothetical protein
MKTGLPGRPRKVEEPKVLENLSEEEAYLLAILSDPSGLDQAEFLWQDQSSEDNKYCPHCGTEANGVHLYEHDELEPEEWELKYSSPTQCFRAWAYQWPWWRDSASLSIDQCARSVGKALDTSTRVPTPSGWTTMGDLGVGDIVYDEHGMPVTVTEAFEVMHDRPCMEMVFDDGSTIVADVDHLWRTWDAHSWKATNRGRPSYQGVRTTAEIASSLRWGREANHRVVVAQALEGSSKSWPITPYLLGLWLGDGDSAQAALTVGSRDVGAISEILAKEGYVLSKMAGPCHYKLTERDAHTDWEFLEPCAPDDRRPKVGTLTNREVRELRELAYTGCGHLAVAQQYGITTASVTQLVRGQFRISAGGWVRGDVAGGEVSRHLRALNLIKNKHIPRELLRASVGDRLSLLQGLMDSDGHITPIGRCEVTFKSEILASGLYELVVSLGQRAFLSKRGARCNGIEAGPVYRVGFQPRDIVPFRLPRKVERVRAGTPCAVNRLRTRRIVDVRETSARSVRCVSVNSASHLFLVGESMIPTHNSLSIKVRGCAFPWLYPGQEMIITAPELVHLEPIVSLIETQMYATRTLKEMLPPGRSAITHRPFQMNFVNGARIIGRIPQRDGKGVKGLHPIWLELDEAQDYPHNGWVELRETLKRGFEGAKWRAHGVTRGVRDDFYEITQDTPNNRWRIHRLAAMWRPNWTDAERQEAIQKYGSREDPDYRRNILGLHGDKTNPIFVLTQLMKNVDNDPLSDYNSVEYFRKIIKSEKLEMFRQEITDELDFPPGHLSYAGGSIAERIERPKAFYWVGMDIGFTIDPSEILVFVEYKPKPSAQSVFRLLTRLSLVRMPHRQQIQAILHTIDFYRPKVFALDRGGVGLPLYQEMAEHIEAFRAGKLDEIPAWMGVYDLETTLTTIKGYSFGEKLLVELDPTVELSQYDSAADMAAKAGMRRNAKELATDVLRETVDAQRLWLPWDEDLLQQFQGGTWTSNRSMDAYGRRVFSRGNDHVLDASRQAALAWSQHRIEELMRVTPQEPVLDVAVMPW